MAENAEPFCATVADYLSEELHIAVEYVSEGLWQERERWFDAGLIQILWLCGLPPHSAPRCCARVEVPAGVRFCKPARWKTSSKGLTPITTRSGAWRGPPTECDCESCG